MIIKITSEELSMNYSESELSDIIVKYMLENDSFSFRAICDYIFNQAMRENRIQKEVDTEYQGGIKISYFDETLISQLLWEQIWNKKLYINFSKNPYFAPTNEIVFMVRK